MFLIILFPLLIIMAAVLVPMHTMRRRGQRTAWDEVYPFLGIVLWFTIAMTGIGSTASLSNLVIEVFWVTLASIAAPWLRWILLRASAKALRTFSIILTFAPVIVALVLRLTMPTLPE